MFRLALSRLSSASGRAVRSTLPTGNKPQVYAAVASQNLLQRRLIGAEVDSEPDEVFDARWEAFFKNENLDRNTYRRGLDELFGYDLVPEPKILNAAFRAARRLNDVAIPVRILEVVKDKAGTNKEIYPYILDQTSEVRAELGISTPEELGIDTA